MNYSNKWIEEKLGITRKSIRYYEEKGLINIAKKPNGYRVFSEEDIERLWTIKTLIGMNFKVEQIAKMIKEQDNFDFYDTIEKNVNELEKEIEQKTAMLNLARTIKMTGRIPCCNDVGAIKFEDFMKYVLNNWDFAKDCNYEMVKQLNNINENANIDYEKLEKILQSSMNDVKNIAYMFIRFHFLIISKLIDYGEKNEIVQKIVDEAYKYVCQNHSILLFERPITVEEFSKYFSPKYFEGDIGKNNVKMYGKDGCDFISKALNYYKNSKQ